MLHAQTYRQKGSELFVTDGFAPRPTLQRRRDGGRHAGGESPAVQPLDGGALFMEPRFDHDFSRVPARAGQSFPHRADIEQGLGVAIPGRSVVSALECGRRGVPAFTENFVTYFASGQPSMRVAAHEATHLVQHAALTRDADLGAEGHADAVARSIERGDSARDLIGERGVGLQPSLRHYREVPTAIQTPSEWNAGMELRVSDDGRMAVGQDSAKHSFWAEPALIAHSNSTLTSRKSVLRIHPLPSTITGTTTGGDTRILSKVRPENLATGTSGDAMEVWADCGKCGRDVMGAGEGTGGGDMTGVYKTRRRPWWSHIPVFGWLAGLIFGLPAPVEHETAASDPEEMKYEIFNKKLGGTGDKGFRKYQAMSDAHKQEFDKAAGINRFAAPNLGEGFTMSSGGADVPGMEANTWNFHWGGAIMVSGNDRVTLENYAITGAPLVKNRQWEFQMYGSAGKAGQTFHDQHRATDQHGDAPTTVRVRRP